MGEEQKSWAGTRNRKAEAKTIKRLFEEYQSRSVLSTELKKIGSDREELLFLGEGMDSSRVLQLCFPVLFLQVDFQFA